MPELVTVDSMSAMFAFDQGEVFLKSSTFGRVMARLLERIENGNDRRAMLDAVDLNCLWVDQLGPERKARLLPLVSEVLTACLAEVLSNDQLAIVQLNSVNKELRRRYPQLYDGP